MTSPALTLGQPYTLLLVAGLLITFVVWARLVRRDRRLLGVYFGAMLGAFAGAKVVYLVAEGWLFWDSPQRWLIWATGKTILGALLGGYAGVEIAKKIAGYTAPTGDLFALVAPVGIVFGRVGCLLHGCCLGQVCASHGWALRDAGGTPRWPAVPVEIAFNLAMLGVFLVLRARKAWPGQHFHIYLVTYGAFRFAHEFMRATPRLGGSLTGYQWAALACVGLGVWGFWRRAQLARVRVAP